MSPTLSRLVPRIFARAKWLPVLALIACCLAVARPAQAQARVTFDTDEFNSRFKVDIDSANGGTREWRDGRMVFASRPDKTAAYTVFAGYNALPHSTPTTFPFTDFQVSADVTFSNSSSNFGFYIGSDSDATLIQFILDDPALAGKDHFKIFKNCRPINGFNGTNSGTSSDNTSANTALGVNTTIHLLLTAKLQPNGTTTAVMTAFDDTTSFSTPAFVIPVPPHYTVGIRSGSSNYYAGSYVVGEVTFDNFKVAPRIDMAPKVNPPMGQPTSQLPQVTILPDRFIVENDVSRAEFTTTSGLRMISLYSEYLQKNTLIYPNMTRLFLVETNSGRYGAENWQVQSVTGFNSPLQGPTSRGASVQLSLPAEKLSAVLKIIATTSKAFRFELKITNTATTAKAWKTAFPQFGGLVFSGDERNDHYLFPYQGGIIANTAANLRTVYGENAAWWQMIALYSHSRGAGMSLRADDSANLYKGIALRKGTTATTGTTITDAGRTMEPGMMWQDSLVNGGGTSMGFEYVKLTRGPGANFTPPAAAMFWHPGDWHGAMQNYADWAHTAWQWRAPNPKLRDVWNMSFEGWGRNALFEKGQNGQSGQYRTNYVTSDKAYGFDKLLDGSELQSWWTWANKAPWRVPIVPGDEQTEIRRLLKSRFSDGYLFSPDPNSPGKDSGFIIEDPATGIKKFNYNVGDYNGYNPSWGGLPALQTHIQNMKNNDKLALLYTCPVLADDNTALGQSKGPQYGAINLRWRAIDGLAGDIPNDPRPPSFPNTPDNPGYIGAYGAWTFCADNSWFQNYWPNEIKRIVQETGADGVRLDVFGWKGFVCNSPNHQHVFAEPGHNAYTRASSLTTNKIRAALDTINPNIVLTSEYPGNDEMARFLDGSLSGETSNNLSPGLRPVPCNLFRFYFPEHKMYDLFSSSNQVTGPQARQWSFFNAMGSIGSIYPLGQMQILKDNGDAFSSTTPEPLIPTLVPQIYANRFSSANKTILMLLNASGAPASGGLIAAPATSGGRFVDLVSGSEVPVVQGALSLSLAPGATACIAQLPQRISAIHTTTGWNITVQGASTAGDMTVVLSAADGRTLRTHTVTAQTFAVPRPTDGTAAVCKLFQNVPGVGNYLIDQVLLPKN